MGWKCPLKALQSLYKVLKETYPGIICHSEPASKGKCSQMVLVFHKLYSLPGGQSTTQRAKLINEGETIYSSSKDHLYTWMRRITSLAHFKGPNVRTTLTKESSSFITVQILVGHSARTWCTDSRMEFTEITHCQNYRYVHDLNLNNKMCILWNPWDDLTWLK